VHIIGNDFSALQGHPGKFDVVTAFDVIEHVRNPAELLGMMISAVRPGGLLMISTGNTQAWSWRLLGSRYWYCKTPEHMSFMCPEWFQSEVPLHSARIAEVVHFSHATSRVRAVRELLANLLYWCLPSLVAMLRWVVGGDGNNGSRGKLDFTPPSWATAKDHMLVVIARDQA
jgi:SAM-dependent methyltransferase